MIGATSCLFCRVVAGDVGADVVLDEENALAIVDIRQPHEGHVLVLPKRHVETLDLLEQDLAQELAWATVRVSRAVRRAFAPDGINVWQSSGEAAGQEVPHVHIHVFPRVAGDGLMRVYKEFPPSTHVPGDGALVRIADRVRRALA